MAQLKTFYIAQLREWKSQWYKESGLPTEFKAIRAKNDKGEWIFHILDPRNDTKTTFIGGKGSVSLKNRRLYTIPVWDGETETLDTYLDEYGYHALFRSMTLEDYDTRDCVAYNAQMEFASLIRYGRSDLNKWNGYQETYAKFLELEREAVTKAIKSEWTVNFHLEHHSLRPSFSTYGISTPPSIPTLSTEESLKELARETLYWEEQNGTKDKADHAENLEKIRKEVFLKLSIRQMVKTYYGKEASDLYNKLEGMYGEKEIKNQKPLKLCY